MSQRAAATTRQRDPLSKRVQSKATKQRDPLLYRNQSEAEKQFNTSSLYRVPDGYTPWLIRNDYPSDVPPSDATWLNVDPITDSESYMGIIKDYCLLGMPESDFVPQDNDVNLIDHFLFELSSHLSSALEKGLVSRPLDAL